MTRCITHAHAHLDFLACGANLPLWLPPPAPHKKIKAHGVLTQGLQLPRNQLGPPGNAPGPQNNPKPKFPLAARGAAVDTRHPTAGAIQGPGRPARGAFAPGPVEGRHSAVQNSSTPLTSAACGARLELKPHWQNRNAALARPPREECEKHGASPCETSPCEPGFFSPAAPTTHHHHLHHTKTSRS